MKKRIIKTITWILALTILVSNIAIMDVHAEDGTYYDIDFSMREKTTTSAVLQIKSMSEQVEDLNYFYDIEVYDDSKNRIVKTTQRWKNNFEMEISNLEPNTYYNYNIQVFQRNSIDLIYYKMVGELLYYREETILGPVAYAHYKEELAYLIPYALIVPGFFVANSGTLEPETEGSNEKYVYQIYNEPVVGKWESGSFKTKSIATVAAICESGTVEGNREYIEGQLVKVRATAATGYDQSTLVWSGTMPKKIYNGSNYLMFEIPDPLYKSITYAPIATFSLFKYPVRVYESVKGEVDLIQEFEVQYGENITATVPERSGYRVEKWHVNGEDPMDGTVYEALKTSITTPVLNEDVVLYCYWLEEYMITGEADGFGTVEPASTGLIGDETVTLTATNTVYGTFSHWEKDGIDIGPGTLNDTGSELIVTNEKADHKYIAVFTQNEFDILINIKPGEEAGSATATPGENIQLDGCLLEATASIGYDFIQWENEEGLVDEVGKIAISVPYDGDASYDAIFEMKEKHAVTTSVISLSGSSIGNSVSKSLNIETGIEYPAGSSTYTNGSIITMTARDASSCEFVEWRLGDKNGPVASTDRTTTVTVSDENIHYVGIFKNKYFSVAANSNDVNKGTAAVAYSPILATQSTIVRAVAKEGYQFEYWLDESMTTILSYDANYTFTPQSSTTVIAFFDDVIVPQAIVNNVIAPIQEENNQLERTEITDAEVPATTLVDNEDSNNQEDTKESENVNPDSANDELAEETSTFPLILSIIFGILFLVGLGMIVIIVKRKKTEK